MRLTWILLTGLLLGCSIEPSEIDYGKDVCHFCSMTIVDRQHASEIVTSKGRAFKYDAIECMIKDLDQSDYGEIKFMLVSNYNQPGEFIDARESTFLISLSIPSPMGAYLSAFENAVDAEKLKKDSSDRIFSWEEIKTEIVP